jgi:CO/xanthine dehydrogenase Mo-binding subunit
MSPPHQFSGRCGKGFQEADVVIEREFTTATVHQGISSRITPRPWESDGQLTIWESTQGAFTVSSN